MYSGNKSHSWPIHLHFSKQIAGAVITGLLAVACGWLGAHKKIGFTVASRSTWGMRGSYCESLDDFVSHQLRVERFAEAISAVDFRTRCSVELVLLAEAIITSALQLKTRTFSNYY